MPMICWYCHWGWPKPVADIHDKYEAIAGEGAMHYGPAHIVWDDENFERHHVQWCLDEFDKWVADWNVSDHRDPYTSEELEAVRQSLRDLLALPDDILTAEPDDYDDEHPERYPPPKHFEMVHR